MSSLTFKAIQLVDKTKVAKLFVEKDHKLYFSPIKIRINANQIEKIIDRLLRTKGKSYKMNDLEKSVLEELDY